MFQVAHVVGDAAFPTVETDESKSKVPAGWAEMQVEEQLAEIPLLC